MDESVVGSTWMPTITVVDPTTRARLPLEGEPTAHTVDPGGSESQVVLEQDEDEDGVYWVASVQMDRVGTWRLVVATPPPFKDVAVALRYANPVPQGEAP
jgi:hypothetical protein